MRPAYRSLSRPLPDTRGRRGNPRHLLKVVVLEQGGHRGLACAAFKLNQVMNELTACHHARLSNWGFGRN